MDSDDEVEMFLRRNNLLVLLNTNTILQGFRMLTAPRSLRIRNDRPFTGRELIMDILEGHPQCSYDLFRMTPMTFRTLCEEVSEKGIIRTDEVSVEEQIGMFLQILAHSTTMSKVAEDYERSKETVHRCFHQVLRSVVRMRHEYIILPGEDAPIPTKVSEGSLFYPFKNALGAIDGTYIPCIPPKEEENTERWRCRKCFKAQNVLAAVDFNGNFVYVLTGWEGAARDNIVLRGALSRFNFVVPADGFYLADGGYANTRNFITPYRNHPYLLSAFGGRSRYACPEDLFNHRHAQLRNIVENTFDVVKKRFKILEFMRPYDYKSQCNIVMACCVLHNFIRKHTSEVIEEELTNEDPESVPDPITTYFIDLDATEIGTSIRGGIRDTYWAKCATS